MFGRSFFSVELTDLINIGAETELSSFIGPERDSF